MSNKEKEYFNPLSKGNYRNMPCLCDSGKKVKKCHGSKSTINVHELNEITRLIEKYNQDLQSHIALDDSVDK